jgi:hypothetical protein
MFGDREYICGSSRANLASAMIRTADVRTFAESMSLSPALLPQFAYWFAISVLGPV